MLVTLIELGVNLTKLLIWQKSTLKMKTSGKKNFYCSLSKLKYEMGAYEIKDTKFT